MNVPPGQHMVQRGAHAQSRSIGRSTTTVTIDVLPDGTMLDIFDFHRIIEQWDSILSWIWIRLLHVCRRWRRIIFDSPLRLRLRLRCTNSTPIRKCLGVWPPLPLHIDYDLSAGRAPDHQDNVLPALDNPDRVGHLHLRFKDSHLEKLATVLQKPFPVLTNLRLTLEGQPKLLPSGFFGGSVPCLQELCLDGIPFPDFPTLLLSARNLVTLDLSRIRPAGYISPQAMAACLSTLTKLKTLSIEFLSDLEFPDPDQIDPASVTPIVLPSLTSIYFHGVCEYMEGLLAQIDCPCLRKIDICLSRSLDFQVTQLSNLINRSEDLRPPQFGLMDVYIDLSGIKLEISREDPKPLDISLRFSGYYLDDSHLFDVFSQFSPALSNIRQLHFSCVKERGPEIGHSELEQLFRPFTTMQALWICGSWEKHAVLLLENVDAEMAADLFPALEFLYIHISQCGLPESCIANFLEVCQLSGRPVTFTQFFPDFWNMLPWNADRKV